MRKTRKAKRSRSRKAKYSRKLGKRTHRRRTKNSKRRRQTRRRIRGAGEWWEEEGGEREGYDSIMESIEKGREEGRKRRMKDEEARARRMQAEEARRRREESRSETKFHLNAPGFEPSEDDKAEARAEAERERQIKGLEKAADRAKAAEEQRSRAIRLPRSFSDPSVYVEREKSSSPKGPGYDLPYTPQRKEPEDSDEGDKTPMGIKRGGGKRKTKN